MDGSIILGHALTLCLLLWGLLAARRWPALFAVLIWPGTLAHEVLHFAAGSLVGAQPVALSVRPRRHGRDWLLGFVAFARLRWWNKLPVALAPLVLVPASLYFLHRSSLLPWPSLAACLWQLIAVQCLVSAWPSRQDWQHALNGVEVLASFGAFVFTATLLVSLYLLAQP